MDMDTVKNFQIWNQFIRIKIHHILAIWANPTYLIEINCKKYCKFTVYISYVVSANPKILKYKQTLVKQAWLTLTCCWFQLRRPGPSQHSCR
jgi:hypothetical protein